MVNQNLGLFFIETRCLGTVQELLEVVVNIIHDEENVWLFGCLEVLRSHNVDEFDRVEVVAHGGELS